ncbi:MAG TPA: HlyD family efflux transporter periplasmic adaptor subunit [Anaerolineales bacterium]
MMLKRLNPLLLAAVLLLAAFGLSGATSGPVEAQDAGALDEQAAPESLPLKGRVVPQRWVYLSFPTGGRVAEILVEEGQSVPAGAALARMKGSEADVAQVAAAQLELLAAQQAIDALHRNAGAALAQAGYTLAQAREVQQKAGWKVSQMKEPASLLRIEQAYANMQLAELGLQKARQDMEKAEKLWNNRRDPAWYFLSRREFRLNLALLSQQVAQAERKYADSVDKYKDLFEPVDEIDLQQAEADLRVADARVEQAARERDKLLHGPSAEDLALAQARLSAAEKALQAAEASLAEGELTAPFAGIVVSVPGRANQWASRGEPVLVLADVTRWKVEIEELKESEVSRLQVGQLVVVRLDALPDLDLNGQVESTSWVYQENDDEVIYSAEITLSGNHPELRWGMTARIEY